jgi:cytochrome b subunit of formate dehydrogenase
MHVEAVAAWKPKAGRWSRLVLVAACLVLAPRARADIDCLECHGEESMSVTGPHGQRRSLYVDQAVFSRSIHGPLGCQACHGSIQSIPHPTRLPLVDCGSCHTDVAASYKSHGGATGPPAKPRCWDCHGTHDILPASDPASQVAPVNLIETCGHCHQDPAIVGRYDIPMINPVEVFARSVHAAAPAGKKRPAAICVDCHSATGTGHQIEPPNDPRSTVFHFNVPRTCGRCHQEVASAYMRSNHAKAAARGETDAPICTHCHGEHAILPVDDPRSPVYPTNVSLSVCGRCHGNPQINRKYGMYPWIMESWRTSYHGLKSTDGDPEVATCVSCHQAHEILPASDPASSVSPVNRAKTCERCHHGISAAVVQVPIHAQTGIALDSLGRALRLIYQFAIVIIIGLMVVHWIIDLLKQIRDLNRGRQVVRMHRDELWQHTLLMVSFIVLAVTGFAFHYSGSWWARLLFGWEGGFDARRIVHRVAAGAFIATALWHLAYLAGGRGRRFMRDMMPRILDFRQFGQMIAHNLGRRVQRPRFGRFSYIEKAEYWALVWGAVVMTVTGLALWFGNLTEVALGVQALGTMLVVHFYEAVLACLAVLVWHIYSTVFNPPVYPNNPSWYTGKMPIEMYRIEHPAEPVSDHEDKRPAVREED